MTIKDVHYSFRMKRNRLDSKGNYDLRIPELDWKLNEAVDLFIKQRAVLTDQYQPGSFELNNTILDDLKNIVKELEINSFTNNRNKFLTDFPNDYLYFLKGEVSCTKNTVQRLLNCIVKNNYDILEGNNKSSFEWQEIMTTFDKYITLITDGSFTINSLLLKYIKKPAFAHNAEDYYGKINILGSDILQYYSTYARVPKGLNIDINTVLPNEYYNINGYLSVNKEKLFGYVDIELSQSAINEIIDLAISNTIGIINTENNK